MNQPRKKPLYISAIIVENNAWVTCDETARRFSDVSIPVATSCRRKTLSCISNTTILVCYISARDRQTSRNLTNTERVGMLDTTSDNSAEHLLLIWRLGRCVVTSQLLHVPYEGDVTLPGFSAFCARQLEHKQASKIRYLPLIPASSTYPAVLKEEMARLVQISHALGDTWTVITGDQAIYELAVTIRDKHKDEFSKVVMLLGGFHQAYNYVKAICKIMRDSGVEDVLVSAGIYLEGTAKKHLGALSHGTGRI